MAERTDAMIEAPEPGLVSRAPSARFARTDDGPRNQAGGYAIEFAAAFVILFLILYAILNYGLVFLAQQSMNRAAQAGGRALLGWSADASDRTQAALERIETRIAWIETLAANPDALQIAICLPTGPANSHDPHGLCPQPASGRVAQVIIRYAGYRDAPLIPALGGPLFGLPLPATLRAQAQADLGIVYPGEPEDD